VIDIFTIGEYCSWRSTHSAWPESAVPSVLLSSGLPHGV
jgi:hypothetical protein